MKTAVSMLLKENKKALQFLHAAAGFDFEKPYMIHQGEGRFTFNQVMKEVQNQIPGKAKAVILVKPDKTHHWQRLYYIRLSLAGFKGTRNSEFPYYFNDINYFWGVGDLEEMRKHKTATYWIIAQAVEHIRPAAQPKPFDTFTRYTVTGPVTQASDGNRSRRWINAIPVVSRERNERPRNFKPFEAYPFTREEQKGEDIADYIDKSGYLVFLRRRELRRAAEALRAEREKAATLKADYTEREKAIRDRIEKGKSILAAAAQKATTQKEFKVIEDIAYNLGWACYYFGQYESKKAESRYNSRASMERDLEFIESKLEKIA